ncbi:hypothetical protein DTO013E5_311 [Penicillium roqueforti]|uniref:uncharacterized protein n=1 Tax=Penicillium roqueforti TaxID=5082 RepID=UPI00190DA4D2|nr:uncharacterized protein LCP9604111_827 [Penicillium roqueforti]KAF9253301.1 hypothetical protein LCP9604111_827 [Penicillium roqueforti]KAI1838816.1 hypothetical protein CBS147337_541 [Penicillium roqueforti]KAI2680300.1 hypothetical protein CBS147355_3280 [Penicillium roqueforti]KAI2691311.1 hypothetical protein LCP963914a_1512 [Penicillium roqueforti]KAI2706690.1 hypothetical protein CBS147372_601 [Penicillium roqueforti]
MSANLDKSLDDLVGSRRQTARHTARRRGGSRRAATKAPTVGGVKKSTKATPKPAHPAPVAQTGSSKILVSGLPSDVSEANVKSAGPVRRVMLTYNQNGTSRGIASIQFNRADTAAKATKELNGLLVDGRPMKIEVVYDASHVPVIPASKPLTERIAQKARPKSAAAPKAKETKTPTEKTNRRGKGPARPRGRNAGRGKPKTVEELDAEMIDYFTNDAPPAEGTAPVNGTVPQASASQDIGMADEIS